MAVLLGYDQVIVHFSIISWESYTEIVRLKDTHPLKLVLLLMMCTNSDSSSQTEVQKSLEDDTQQNICTYTDRYF